MTAPIRESAIERALVARIEALGGIAEKTISLSGRGYFDRVALLPGGRVIFAEIKKPRGGRVSPHQRARHTLYRALGAEVALVRTIADIDRLLPAARSD